MSSQPVTLSQMGQQVYRVRCDACNRRGQYRADRLLGLVGDLTVSDALQAVGKLGKCRKAVDPPSIYSMHYATDRCQIKVDKPPPRIPATIGKAMHGKWRGYIECQRHHQGLKQAKPCGVEHELDLATLVAALGYDFEIERLPAKLNAPCCGGRMFGLRWYIPTEKP